MPREIDALQFGVTLLLLAFALAALWLLLQRVGRLHRRFEGLARSEELMRIEEAVSSDARFGPIEESVRRLADAIARLPAPLEAKDLVPLQERIEQLTRATDELRHHVDELRSREAVGSGSDVGPGVRVLRTLEQRGFDSIRILATIPDDDGAEAGRIPVEARRAGMSFKGFVTLADGRVADVSLKPVTEVFP